MTEARQPVYDLLKIVVSWRLYQCKITGESRMTNNFSCFSHDELNIKTAMGKNFNLRDALYVMNKRTSN